MNASLRRGESEARLPLRRKLFFAALVLVFCYGLAELVWMVWAPLRFQAFLCDNEKQVRNFIFDDTLGVRFRPGDWYGVTPRGETARFHINRWGLRGDEVEVPKPAGTFRILCLGGSTTFGTTCLADSLSYPAQLESALRRLLPERNVEVLNGGVPSYTTVESGFNLDRLTPLAPDLVLVYHGINDITLAEKVGSYYLQPAPGERPPSRGLRYKRDAESSMLRALVSRLTGVSKNRIPADRAAIDPRVRTAFGEHLRSLAERARRLGGEAGFVTFQAMFGPGASPALRKRVEDDKAFQYHKLAFDALVEEFGRFNQIMRSVANEISAPVFEVEGRVPSDEGLWGDALHMNGHGSKRMVDAIAPDIAVFIRTR